MAIELAKGFEQAAIHRTFSRWRARVGDQHQDHLRAALHHESLEDKRVKRAFNTWRTAADRIKANQAAATKARAFFAQRLALRVWRDRLIVQRQEAWLEERRLKDLRQSFDGEIDPPSIDGLLIAEWRFRLQQHGEDARILDAFWAKQDQVGYSRRCMKSLS